MEGIGVSREVSKEGWRAFREGREISRGTATALPIKHGGKVIGICEIEGLLDSLGKAVISISLVLAASVWAVSSREEKFSTVLMRKRDELSRLRRCGWLISSRLKLEETLESILQMALEVTGAHYGIFRILEGDSLVTRAIAGEGLERPLVDKLPLDASASVSGWVAENKRSVLIKDVSLPPWCELYYPLDQVIPMRSAVTVPLLGPGGRLEGILNLESPQVGGFSEQDKLLLEGLAVHAVTAISQAQLLDAVQELAGGILRWSWDEILDRLLYWALQLLHPRGIGIFRNFTGKWECVASAPASLPEAYLYGVRDVVSTLRSEESFLFLHSSGLNSDCRKTDEDEDYSCLILSLGEGVDRPVGAMAIIWGQGYNVLNDWDRKVASCLAFYAGLAIEKDEKDKRLALIQKQKSLAESFAAIGDMAANLMHQLNNKVGVIPVKVQGIELKCSDLLIEDSYLAKNLSDISMSAQEALRVVRDNLGLLRPVDPKPIVLQEVIEEAWNSMKHEVCAVGLSLQGLEELPPVKGGVRSVFLVFHNLLENAVRAMEGRGWITVSGRLVGNEVEVKVADTGPGIPYELRDKIFEFDFSRRSVEPYKLGFGLWWVKTLMARVGGRVWLDSADNGAVFGLSFPEPLL